MAGPRKAALRNALIIVALAAPIWLWIDAIDRGVRGVWAPNTGFFVALLVPAAIGLLRSAYVVLMGRPGPYPLFGPRSTT